MATGDDRKYLAERLRGPFDVFQGPRYWELNGSIFGLYIMAGSEELLRHGLAKIADLIDPDLSKNGPEFDTNDPETAGELKKATVNRDWLLEIADRLEREYPDSRDAAIGVMEDAASEIRKAVGA